MSSGVEAAIALDAAVVLSLGTSRILGGVGQLTGAGAEALAALAEGRAEAHAAALAELERHERAVRKILEINARIAVLSESADRHRLRVAIPIPLDPAGIPVEELLTWAESTGRLLDGVEEEITQGIAVAAVGSIFGARTSVLDRTAAERPAPDPETPLVAESLGSETSRGAESLRSETSRGAESLETETSRVVEAKETEASRVAETLVRVMSRLAPDTSDADRRLVGEAAERVGAAATSGEAEGLLNEVRIRVQDANRRTAERHAEAAREAARREAAEQAEAERRYLLDAVTSAFEELGYTTDEGFETLTARGGAVILSRSGWPDHAIKMRVDDATQIRAALVRTVEPASEEERRVDVEREAEWCAAFEAARRRLTGAGVRSDVRWRIDPGEHRLPVAPEARQTRARSKQRERSRERGRDG